MDIDHLTEKERYDMLAEMAELYRGISRSRFPGRCSSYGMDRRFLSGRKCSNRRTLHDKHGRCRRSGSSRSSQTNGSDLFRTDFLPYRGGAIVLLIASVVFSVV